MRLIVPFNEIEHIIDEKVKQPISFEYVDEKTLRIKYELNLFVTKKTISTDLEIKGMKGSDLFLGYGSGNDKMLVSTALQMVGNKIPAGLIEENEAGNLTLHLDKIEQAKTVFEKIDVQKILVMNESLGIEGQLKL